MLRSGYHTSTVLTWVRSFTGSENSVAVTADLRKEPFIRIEYTNYYKDGHKVDHKQEINLITTGCNYGGIRYWFVCPKCYKRVGGVYMTNRDFDFMCRRCNKLTYHSRNRCVMAALGHTSRQKKKLIGEMKRWTWRGKPTRKARKLDRLKNIESALVCKAWVIVEKMKGR